MPGPADLSRDVDIDIAGLFREVWKRMWLVVAAPLVAGVALFIVLGSMDPSYRSSARIIIEKRESVFTRRSDGDFTLSGSQFDEQAVGSQVEILTSADLALKVIARLDLTKHPEFAGSGPSMLQDLLALVGSGAADPGLTAEERILADFNKRLSVYAIEKSRVISVEFWAHDRDLAQAVPNALADEYMAVTKASQLQSTEEAAGWLGKEIEELRAKVRVSEEKVANYRASSDILVGTNNALLATQQLSETSSELSRVRSERSAAEGKAAAIRAALEQGASIDTLPEVISSPLIQRLRERAAALQAEISELETTLLPNHPRLKALKSQTADFEEQIRGSARNILKSLESNVDLLRKQEAILLQEVNRLKTEAGRVGEAEVELRALEREATAQRELLETYLTRFREAASRQNNEYLPIDARIISRAVTPADSFFPKVVPFTIAGMAGALVLVVTGILAWALLAGRAFKETGYPAFALPEKAADFDAPPAAVRPQTWPDEAAAVPLETAQPPAPVRFEPEPPAVFRSAPAPVAAYDRDEPRATPASLAAEFYEPEEDSPATAVLSDPRELHDSAGASFDEPLSGGQPTVNRRLSEVLTLPPREDIAAWRKITSKIDIDAADYAKHLSAALEEASVRPPLRAQDLMPAGPAPASDSGPAREGGAERFDVAEMVGLLESLERAKLCVVSPGGDEGSVVAWEIVRRLASSGRNTLLVDLTGSGVTSAEFAGSPGATGLRDVLAGTQLLRQAIVRDRQSRALVLPAGAHDGEGLFEHLASTLDALARAFDYVVLDCGLTGADGLQSIASTDDIVVVSVAGASEQEIAETEAELREAGYAETVSVAPADFASGRATDAA